MPRSIPGSRRSSSGSTTPSSGCLSFATRQTSSLILDALLVFLPSDRIVAVTIPDYTVTPSGTDFGDPTQQHDAIVANNAVMARLASDRSIAVVDIFDISLEAAVDRGLVAGDGLHPSGAQYARWVERLVPAVRALLRG